jgi:hypothetical protein
MGQAGSCSPPPPPVDTDADGIANGGDNCPLTGNADQADADPNGVGDACAPPFLDGVAYTTADGVVEAAIDDRRRITRVVGPDWSAILAWSEAADHVEIAAEEHGISGAFGLDMDVSDVSLLRDLDELQAETGRDVSFLRQWITDHPGQVLAAARGQVSAQADKRLSPRQQDVPTTEAEVYIGQLTVTAAIISDTVCKLDELRQSLSPTDPPDLESILFESALDFRVLWAFFADLLDEQAEACSSCLLACHIACAPVGTGACCPGDGRSPCFHTDQITCTDGGGRFSAGFSCADIDCWAGFWGACVAAFGAVTTCSEQREIDCAALDGIAYPDESCSAIPAPGGACTYETTQGHMTCVDSIAELCGVLEGTYEAGVFCASGACYYDAGGVTLCVHTSPVDCNGLGGDFNADWLCLGYTSALECDPLAPCP